MLRIVAAEIDRARGNILSEKNPADEAFLAAIGIAQQQKTKSFGLRAALALGQALPIDRPPRRSPRRLAPALEGFSADARNAGDRRGAGAASGLTQAGEVKAQGSRRERLTQLQLAYGNALFAARGSGVVGFPQPRRPRLRSAMTALRRFRPLTEA